MRFTHQRDPYGRLSACADGPPGRDVDCRIHVRVRQVPAGYAPENRLALTVLRCAMPADVAGLRSKCGIHPLDPPRRLLFQATNQGAPTVGQDAPIQACFGAATVREVRTWLVGIRSELGPPGELPNPQIFHADQIKPPRDFRACLLNPVSTTVDSTGVKPGDRDLDPQVAPGATSAAREATLQALQASSLSARPPRANQKLPGAQGGRHSHTAVDTDDLARHRRRDLGGKDSERDVPPPCSVPGNPVGPCSGHRSGEAKPHPADLRHIHRRPLAAELHESGCLRADDPEAFVLPGFAPRRPPSGAAVEVLESLVEIAERLLLNGLRTCLQPIGSSSRLRQLPCLLDIPGCWPLVAREHRPLLNSQVPHIPGVSTALLQRALLCGTGVHPEAGHGVDPTSRHRQFLRVRREGVAAPFLVAGRDTSRQHK